MRPVFPLSRRHPMAPAAIALIAAASQMSCTGSEPTLKAKANVDPQISISAPSEGDTFTEQETIDLVATVSDGNGLDDLVSLLVLSDVDGELAQPDPDNNGTVRWSGTLSAGNHTLTVRAADSQGAAAEDSVSLVITDVDQSPIAIIQSPADLDSFGAGDAIALVGEASDPNQDPDTLTAIWSYEPTDGGANVEIATATPSSTGIVNSDWVDAPSGRWKLIFEVVDDDGFSSTDLITVTVDSLTGTDTYDDDGDCFCESPDTCEGSANPDCDTLDFDDCDDDDATLTPEDLDGDGVSTCDGDCDDDDDARFPGQLEVPLDGIDQDCDLVDDCYMDLDGDGYGDGLAPGSNLSCDGVGDAIVDGDCDDDDDGAYPGAAELTADGTDQDCDGMEMCYADLDEDGFGVLDLVPSADLDCSTGPVADNADDCVDDNPDIRPTATELLADGIDQNCDLQELCYVDNDGDGVGTLATGLSSTFDCSELGYSLASDDCNDLDPSSYPGATEVPADGSDQDCDSFELCYTDADGDGFGGLATEPSPILTCVGTNISAESTDCDDDDDATYFGAPEVLQDGIDQDCDTNDSCYVDTDGDGYGDAGRTFVASGLTCPTAVADGDCDDDVDTVNPAAVELQANGVDDNCDGLESCYADDDGDGFGGDLFAIDSADLDCADAGEYAAADDCDDTEDTINPGAADLPDMSFVDTNCDGIDGDVSKAVFVVETGGNDGGACSQTQPCATVDEALTRLVGPIEQVLVGTGSFGLLELTDDAAVYGGYASDWSRSDALSSIETTTFVAEGYGSPAQYMAIRADAVSNTRLQNVVVQGIDVAEQDGSGNGKSSYGMYVRQSDLVLDNVEVLAGQGASGIGGTDAGNLTVRADDGNFGLNGTGSTNCSTSLPARNGASGGSNTCAGTDVSGGDGGNGGTSDCTLGSSFATSGQDGDDGFSVDPGIGGDGGQTSINLATRHGDNGTRGTDGADGTASPATGGGSLIGGYWSGVSASTGGVGQPGSGGGGGGGGAGAQVATFDETRGGSGGGGGAGGCGASGGNGGRGGGASIGIYASSSTLTITTGRVEASGGGNGGVGGDGGSGQQGGLGRAGGNGATSGTISPITSGDGGNGGNGGNGGDGAGGTGGAGGPSWAILQFSSTVTTGAATLQAGSGGNGGNGGDGAGAAADGSTGVAGPSAATKVCTSAFDCF